MIDHGFETTKGFDKLVYKIKDSSIKRRLKAIFVHVEKADSLDDIHNLKAITGHPGYYRIKLSDYRVGISLEDGVVWFLYFGKRDKSTYKKFP